MFGKDCKRLKKLVEEIPSNDDLSKAVVKEFGEESRLDVVTLDNEVSAYMAASKMLSEDLDNNGYLITAMYIKKIEGDRIKFYVVSLKDNAEKEEDDDTPTVGELFVSLNNKWLEDNKGQIEDEELCKSIGGYVRKEIAENVCGCEDDLGYNYSCSVTVISGKGVKVASAIESVISSVKDKELVEAFVKEVNDDCVLCSLLLRTKKD